MQNNAEAAVPRSKLQVRQAFRVPRCAAHAECLGASLAACHEPPPLACGWQRSGAGTSGGVD